MSTPETEPKPITPAQCRAARGLLNWDQATLAKHANITRQTVIDFEAGRREASAKTVNGIWGCFETAGVRFIAEGGEVGVVARSDQPGLGQLTGAA